MTNSDRLQEELEVPDCIHCGEGWGEINECPNSERPCGHHCNHMWSAEVCCWCGAIEEDE